MSSAVSAVASAVGGSSGGGGGLIGGLAGGAGSIWNSVTGNTKAADAAQQAANAQAAVSNQYASDSMAFARQNQSAAMNFASATPQELASLSRSYQAAGQSLDMRQQQLSAIDPAIMEASKQALDLMRGGTAAANKPLMDQRNLQRTQLVNSLRSQYGPGGENSSAGQRALQQFDLSTNSMFQTNQQSSLAQMMGYAGQDLNANAEIGGMMGVGQGYGNIQQRQVNAALGSGSQMQSAMGNAFGARSQAAGAPYVGQALQAQGQQQMFGTLLNLGSMYATGGASGMRQQAPSGGMGSMMTPQGPGNYGNAGGSYTNYGNMA